MNPLSRFAASIFKSGGCLRPFPLITLILIFLAACSSQPEPTAESVLPATTQAPTATTTPVPTSAEMSQTATPLPIPTMQFTGEMLLVTNVDGTNTIKEMDLAAGHWLPTIIENAAQPVWLAATNDIGFTRCQDGDCALYLLSDPAPVLVAPGSSLQNGSWSEDGRFLAYSSTTTGTDNIYVMDFGAESPQPLRLTSSSGNNTNPVWAAGDSFIIFTTDRDGDDDIAMMAADGSNPILITRNEVADSSPAVSPDGTKIAYLSEADGAFNLFVLDVVTNQATQLTADPTPKASPTWSPDGRFIAYLVQVDQENFQLTMIAADGSDLPVQYTLLPPGPYAEIVWKVGSDGQLPTPTPPTPTPTPTPTPEPETLTAGPFHTSLILDEQQFGSVTGLRLLPDGRLLLTTTFGSALLQDGVWTTQQINPDYQLIGVDDDLRTWYFPTDNPHQIYQQDQSGTPVLADEGWLPLTDSNAIQGRGLLSHPNGDLWLAAEKDIRRFHMERWTIFTLADLGISPPPDEYMPTLFTLERMEQSNQIWVGACHWGGPGPIGGGVRWFDGTDWQGADSPVATGCTTTMQEDSQGRVWLGLDDQLWRYDPAEDAWHNFPPPTPPEEYRFGYITELSLDPSGEPWLAYALCGGASCALVDLRYRLDDGIWVPVGNDVSFQFLAPLLFDGSGTPWLFPRFLVYRIEADELVAEAELDVSAAVVDANGRIWAATSSPTLGVWLLEEMGGGMAETAVCPPPNQANLPQITARPPDSSIADLFAPQIQAYLNAGGDAQGLVAQLNNLTLDIGGGTIWQALVEPPIATDLTGDGVAELIFPLLFYEANQYFNGDLFVFHCHSRAYVGGSIAALAGSVVGEQPDTVLIDVLDMNGNGLVDIVFTTITVVGTHANFTREVRILEWDGTQFVDLIQGDGNNPSAAEVRNAQSPDDIRIHDIDGDGILELELINGAGRGPDAGEDDQRMVDTWAWNGMVYVLVSSQPMPSP